MLKTKWIEQLDSDGLLLRSALESFPELINKRIMILRSDKLAYFAGYTIGREARDLPGPIALLFIVMGATFLRFGWLGVLVGVVLITCCFLGLTFTLNPTLLFRYVPYLKKLDGLILMHTDLHEDAEKFVLFHELTHLSHPGEMETEVDLMAAQKLGWTLEQLLENFRKWKRGKSDS